MKKSRMDIYQKFLQLQQEHSTLKLPNKLTAMLHNCQYIIHKQFDKNSRAQYLYKKHKYDLSTEFRYAFKSLSIDEKLEYYIRHMEIIINCFECKGEEVSQLFGIKYGEGYARSYDLRIWKKKILRLDRQKCILYVERETKIKKYILSDYILRKSKNTQYYGFVLEAVNDNPHQKSKVVNFGFNQEQKLREWMQELLQVYGFLEREYISKMMREFPRELNRISVLLVKKSEQIMGVDNKGKGNECFQSEKQESQVQREFQMNRKLSKRSIENQFHMNPSESKPHLYLNQQSSYNQKQSLNEYQIQSQEIKTNSEKSQSHSERLITKQQQQQRQNSQKEKQQVDSSTNIFTQCLEIFHKVLPNQKIKNFHSCDGYEILWEQDSMKIYSSAEDPHKFKMIYKFNTSLSAKQMAAAMNTPQLVKKCNQQIEQITLTTQQSNSLIYMRIKPYSKLYRSRDYIYSRYIYKFLNQQYLILDKDTQNSNYPQPSSLSSIVRGSLTSLWSIKKTEDTITLHSQIIVNNSGNLKPIQNTKIMLKYLQGYKQLQQVYNDIQSGSYKGIDFGKFHVCDIDHSKMKIEKIQEEQ